jgi:hypothetical protein
MEFYQKMIDAIDLEAELLAYARAYFGLPEIITKPVAPVGGSQWLITKEDARRTVELVAYFARRINTSELKE